MDPLTVALTVVTLATAVKDLVELGSKIHESFCKTSSNLHRAQVVAEEIKEMLDDLSNFYRDNPDVLETTTDFRTSLQELLLRLKVFEMKTLPLLPKPKFRLKDRFIRGWASWRKSDEIEMSIWEIRNDIKRVIRKFVIMRSLRMETKMESIHQSTTRGIEVLGIVQKDVSSLHISLPSGTSLSNTSSGCDLQNIVKFASTSSSTSSPILLCASVANDELISTAYITFQIGNIMAGLREVAKLSQTRGQFQHNSSIILHTIPSFSMSIINAESCMTFLHLQHQTVREATLIRDMVGSDITGKLLAEAVVNLTSLSTCLYHLNRKHDAAMISELTIILCRMLVSPDNPDSSANLALNLFNHSVYNETIGNQNASFQAIEEACTITQQLPCVEGYLILRASVVDQFSGLVYMHKKVHRAIELVGHLIELLGITLGVKTVDVLGVDGGFSRVSPAIEHLHAATISDEIVLSYAKTLLRMAELLARDGQLKEAWGYMHLSLAIHCDMSNKLGSSFDEKFAIALRIVVKFPARILFPLPTLLEYVDQCIFLYRRASAYNSEYYLMYLIRMLCAKATLLEGQHRGVEALEVGHEAVHLAKELAKPDCGLYPEALNTLSGQFHRLFRFNDAANARATAIEIFKGAESTLAGWCLLLYQDFCLAGRYMEATQAAHRAVAMYRSLALKDSGKWAANVAVALSKVAESLKLIGDYDHALQYALESIRVLDSLISAPTLNQLPNVYIRALSSTRNLALVWDSKLESFALYSEVQRLHHALATHFPRSAEVAKSQLICEQYHGYNLYRLGLPSDARRHFEELLGDMDMKPAPLSIQNVTGRRISIINLYAEILFSLGNTDLASAALHDAGRSAEPHLESDDVCKPLVVSVYLEVSFATPGDSANALRIAEEMLHTVRRRDTTNSIGLICALHAVALAASKCEQYRLLLEIAMEAINLCQKDDTICLKRRVVVMLPVASTLILLPRSLQLYSLALANLGDIPQALQYAREAVEQVSKIKILPGLGSFHLAQAYFDARGHMADMLLASGNIHDAVEILEERRNYLSKRVETMNGEYRELIPTLRILGVLYCHEGRHDDGKSTAQEFHRIIESLACVLPSLHTEISSVLRHKSGAPLYRILAELCCALKCNDQARVLSA